MLVEAREAPYVKICNMVKALLYTYLMVQNTKTVFVEFFHKKYFFPHKLKYSSCIYLLHM